MKNIKDITLSAFAVIGFYTIITAFTSTESNPAQQVINGTPASHVWEVYTREGATAWLLNKKSGEIIGMDASSRKKFKLVWRK